MCMQQVQQVTLTNEEQGNVVFKLKEDRRITLKSRHLQTAKKNLMQIQESDFKDEGHYPWNSASLLSRALVSLVMTSATLSPPPACESKSFTSRARIFAKYFSLKKILQLFTRNWSLKQIVTHESYPYH